MRNQARIVIVGAGIVGCSTAYHLAQRGWRDVVVLEQGPLFETGGSTSHAPGLVFQLNASKTMCTLAQYSVAHYGRLRLGELPCFHSVGSLEVAWTKERLIDLSRKAGLARSWGLEAALLTPEEARARNPLLSERILGAFHVPSDGLAKAVRACEAMGREAQARGVEFISHAPVTGVEVSGGRVRAVLTEKGRIQTDCLLVAAGIWGPRVGRLAGVTLPLCPVQHQYVRTGPLPELKHEKDEVRHPIVRHQDRALYFRQHADAYGIGSYKHEPLLVEPDRIPKHAEAGGMPSVLPFTPKHFGPAWEAAQELLPCLRNAPQVYQINGMFSFTPDGMPLLGESAEVRGFWSAEAVWVTHGPGVGKVMAEWLNEGVPSLDLRECDLNRFHRHALTRSYVRARAAQQYREVYDIIHPLQQMEHPRNLRLSPFHVRQKELGAVFVESSGWERPQWFAANEKLLSGLDQPGRTGWAARNWSPVFAAEHQAARQRVALFDLTSFVKLEISGPKALEFMQYLCSNQMDQPVGKVTYTTLLDAAGGIRADLTITRLGPQRFWVLTGAGTGMRDLAWIKQHLPEDESVQVADSSSAYCALGVWGPKARELLQSITGEPMDGANFPFLSARYLQLGEVPALAVRISYVGESGWEIYAPAECGMHLWDTLMRHGEPLGITAAGLGAFDSLRLEKGYRSWGADIHTEHDPFSAGLGFTVRLNKGPFLGREALQRIKARGLERKLCCLTLDDPKAVVLGKEPILANDSSTIGYVTSANYGFTVGKFIAYGYLPNTLATPGTRVSIEYFGERYGATVAEEPLYDPKNLKLKDLSI